LGCTISLRLRCIRSISRRALWRRRRRRKKKKNKNKNKKKKKKKLGTRGEWSPTHRGWFTSGEAASGTH
jgi:hypothetical protein